MSDPAAVEFEHVFKAFGNRKILDDVSFKVNVGEALCILGRSGTGIGAAKDSVMDQPIIIEGYSNHASAADEMATSRSRSLLIAHYLEKRFHLSTRNIGLMPLSGTAPSSSGKDSWDGACIVLLPVSKVRTDARILLGATECQEVRCLHISPA